MFCVLCSMLCDVLLFRKIGNEHKQNNRCRTAAAAKTEKWEIKRKKKVTSMCRKLFLRHLIFFFFSLSFVASSIRLSYFVNLFRAITYSLRRSTWHFLRSFVLKSFSRKISLNKVNESLVNS